jgi:two-component system, OmpR family, response regulator
MQTPATQPSARRILVVDDNVDVANSFVVLLSAMGHEVHAVHSGEEALKAARTLAPEVVFLDLGMPGMDGYETARNMRTEHPQQAMVLVAMTGYGPEQHEDAAGQHHFDHHLLKPVDIDVLETVLRDLPSRP